MTDKTINYQKEPPISRLEQQRVLLHSGKTRRSFATAFRTNIILAQGGLETDDFGMSKKLKKRRASIANAQHLHSLPRLGLSIQYKTFEDAEPFPSRALPT